MHVMFSISIAFVLDIITAIVKNLSLKKSQKHSNYKDRWKILKD
jgi:hypothetical protein